MTFEQWYEQTVGISVNEAQTRDVHDLELLRQCWADAYKQATFDQHAKKEILQ